MSTSPEPILASPSLPDAPLHPRPGLSSCGTSCWSLPEPFLNRRGYKHSTEQPVTNLVIKSCAPVQVMRLREVDYPAQSHTARMWQKHHLVGPDTCISNTFTLLLLILLMKISYVAMTSF
ncbi:recQ-mediated genome instability protein 1 isoform X2 [Elephas maximus indicus]|uniref:recQ-mediated genome instability protein 1 isoform X2 n=1 Tax=Elephas maximus indicus TaxID=99487 RepID=UPI0021162717|nr:recQ-mediated genome instability protein 1 isoform X2 [Elephas maximus indicus]